MKNKELSDLKVLIVDDIASARSLISAALIDIGINQISTAKDGKEALRIFRDDPQDLIISDWNMPKMCGLTLLKNLRPNRLDQSFKFLLITSEQNSKKLREASALGVDDYIIKPFNRTVFEKKIKSLIHNKIDLNVPKRDFSVVVVEDSRSTLLILGDILEDIGFKDIVFFENATEALGYLRNNRAGLILSDWHMPDIDGIEFCRMIRERTRTRNTPFLIVTAEKKPEMIRLAIDSGVDGYLIKPFHQETILRELARVMSFSDNK